MVSPTYADEKVTSDDDDAEKKSPFRRARERLSGFIVTVVTFGFYQRFSEIDRHRSYVPFTYREI